MKKLLQLLVPQYNETDKDIKPLLDSISIQQGIDFNDIGVLIMNDGKPENVISKTLLSSYNFDINYYLEEHRGIAGTRAALYERSNSEYVMWCDSDDMFLNNCGLHIILSYIKDRGFEVLHGQFVEQSPLPNGDSAFITRDHESVFVHGKVFSRKFLDDNDIKWNPNLTYHEDHNFITLALSCAENRIYYDNPIYLYRWRDNSLVREDPMWVMKTYHYLLDSNEDLIEKLIAHFKFYNAQLMVSKSIYNTYFELCKPYWDSEENKFYKDRVEKRFKEYYLKYKDIFEELDIESRAELIEKLKIANAKKMKFFEKITFYDWIKHIEEL